MQETDWINEAVKEFKKGFQELQKELSKAANGTLLDVSDEQIMKNLEPLLKKAQQQAVQKALEKAQKDSDSQWRTNYCHVLREKGAMELINRLKKSKARLSNETKICAMDKLLGFLMPRVERMDYPSLLAGSYRIDSGPIESSCKNVVQARMKCSGMRWSRHGGSAMLEIRCALFSDKWEDLLQNCA